MYICTDIHMYIQILRKQNKGSISPTSRQFQIILITFEQQFYLFTRNIFITFLKCITY